MHSAMLETERTESVFSARRIAFTGRMASLMRPEAVEMIQSLGAQYTASVTRGTQLLVVGQDGWPLRPDGRVSRKLLRARRLQQAGNPIEVLQEDEFLDRLGLHDLSDGIRRRYTLDELTRLAKVPGGRIRAWVKAGLLQPQETIGAVGIFGFQQVTAIRTLDSLMRSGISIGRLRRSLRQLRIWLPEAHEALARLDRLNGGRRIGLRNGEGRLLESTGQHLIEFDEPATQQALSLERPDDADSLFERAVELEDASEFECAVEAYREWLLRFGPDASVCFNLGNSLYALGQREAAIERFRQVVEMSPDHADAWSNLGSVLAESGQGDAAIAAFGRALESDAGCGNALYNLADTLEELGRPDEARVHWEAYLKRDTRSPWAEHARSRLAQ